MTDRGKGWLILAGVSLVLWVMIFMAFSTALAQRAGQSERVRVMVTFTNFESAEALCSIASAGRLQASYACANPEMIIAPHPCLFRSDAYARILCHEIRCHVTGNDTHHVTPECRAL